MPEAQTLPQPQQPQAPRLARKTDWLVPAVVLVGAAGATGVLIWQLMRRQTGAQGALTIEAVRGPLDRATQRLLSEVRVNQLLDLVVDLRNTGPQPLTVAVEAVITDGVTVVDNWYSYQHPPGNFPGRDEDFDDPTWMQFRTEVPPGGSAQAKFGTVYLWARPGRFYTVAWAAPLPAGYRGPIVVGKRPGLPFSALQLRLSAQRRQSDGTFTVRA